jgi:hypothetical protein
MKKLGLNVALVALLVGGAVFSTPSRAETGQVAVYPSTSRGLQDTTGPHLITYLRLLDADAEGADWREVARRSMVTDTRCGVANLPKAVRPPSRAAC